MPRSPGTVGAALRILLLGASGFVGRLVARELRDRGHTIVAGARDAGRVRAVLGSLEVPLEAARTVDAADRPALEGALDEVDACLDASGAAAGTGNAPLEAAIRRGVHHLDLTLDPATVRDAYDRLDGPAREAGISAVPAAGVVTVPGDLLADVVVHAVTRPREVHVAYALPDRHWRRTASAGVRRSSAALVGRPVLAYDGGLVEEPIAEARRLAWFPRPLGPHHAAGVPGVEPLSVPRHAPSVRVVRTYLAVPTWRAELLQLTGNAARWAPVGRRLQARALLASDPSPALRASIRWACVVETAGEEGVARAWCYGSDPYAFAARSIVTLAEHVVAGRAAGGVVPPALVDVPGALLDDLAARGDLRWAVRRPGS